MRLEDVGEGGRLPGYLLGKVVGEGGFCKVRAAIHRVTGAKTAVKLIEKAKLRDPEDRARLGREIKVLKRLSHRHVIRLFDVVEDARWVFCVMEYADGGSLLDHVRARRRVPEPEAARFAYQLCQALACCHASGVAHRDVKLENVLLDARRDVKLIDFGLAAFTSPGRKLETHCGSPSYAAPEIVQRKPYDGPPVDVWSTGVVLFACVAGHLPFHAPKNDKKELCRKIASGAYVLPSDASKDFADVVSVILRVDPTRRASLATVLESRWIANRERRGEDERARAYASDDERRRKKTPGRAASARETAASGGFSGPPRSRSPGTRTRRRCTRRRPPARAWTTSGWRRWRRPGWTATRSSRTCGARSTITSPPRTTSSRTAKTPPRRPEPRRRRSRRARSAPL